MLTPERGRSEYGEEKQETRFSAELLDELLEGQDAATVLQVCAPTDW